MSRRQDSHEQRRVRTSKRLSFLLRHHPEAEGLELDEEGFTTATVAELAGLLGTTEEWLLEVVEHDPKQRFELRDDRLRARFGHSVEAGSTMWEGQDLATAEELPEVLYHGTAGRNLESIMAEGLRPGKRQHVHLSTSVHWARQVGGRYAKEPVVLEVDVPRALELGVELRVASESTVLADHVPPGCLRRRSADDTDGPVAGP